MKRILIVAFDFTPSRSPGVERVLKFARHLNRLGWEPIVLTVNDDTYENKNIDYEVENFPVYRTFCLNVSKHLAYKGKYFGWMKQPDRYWGWCFTAIPKGVELVRKYKVDAVFSSYPVLTSHMVAGMISKLTKKPWLADYRDPLQCYYHKEVYKESKLHRIIDRWVIRNCNKAIFATEGALELYKKEHRDTDYNKFNSVYNGVDSLNFSDLMVVKKDSRFVLLHTGSLYASGRDPTTLFEALVHLKELGVINQSNFVVKLRGENNELLYAPKIKVLGINDVVEFLPSIPYKECLSEMQQVDALLVIQGGLFYSQIPGKLYEYFATNKPILAITSEESETEKLILDEEGAFAAINTKETVKVLLMLLAGHSFAPRNIEKYERHNRAKELAELLNDLTNN